MYLYPGICLDLGISGIGDSSSSSSSSLDWHLALELSSLLFLDLGNNNGWDLLKVDFLSRMDDILGVDLEDDFFNML